jgi:cytochrome c biogenesis protein CcmG, thiol:disulfide interchange protein DsbE
VRRLTPLVLLLIVAWTIFVWLPQARPWQRANAEAPAFSITTFDGAPLKLADLQGQGVVLNFWASWCGPCRAEAALLEQVWRQEAGRGVQFVGLNVQDNEAGALRFLAEYGVSYPNGPDPDSQWYRAYGAQGMPTTIFIGPDGRISGRIYGAIPSAETMEPFLAQIRTAP